MEKMEGFKEDKQKKPALEGIEIPELESIDGILEESEKIASLSALTEEEANELLEKRFSAIEELRDLNGAVKERLASREEPLAGISPDDYGKLAEEGLITVTDAARLEKISQIIGKLEALENPSAAASAEMERLKKLKETAGEKIESRIEDERLATAERMEEMKNKMMADAIEKADKLEKIISEAEGNPEVLEKLQTMAEEEMSKIEEEKNKEKEKFLKEVERSVQSVSVKHASAFKRLADVSEDEQAAEKLKGDTEEEKNKELERFSRSTSMTPKSDDAFGQALEQIGAFKRLAERTDVFEKSARISGGEQLKEKLFEGLKNSDRSVLKSVIDGVRSRVLKAIIEGEGEKQIKSLREIVPWLSHSSVPYFDAVDFLRYRGTERSLRDLAAKGDERAKKLVESRDRIISENEILRMLIGKKWVVDKKNGSKKPSAIFAAFETRKENDKKGITEARKKAREEAEKQKAEFTKEAKEVVERGGFIVREPIKKKVKGRWQEVGGKKLAVRVEKVEAKTGNMVWKIAEIVGETNSIRVEQTSPLNKSSFPEWLREAIKVPEEDSEV